MDPSIRVLVIAYEAATTIAATLDRVPTRLAGRPTSIVVSDDASSDDTSALARAWAALSGRPTTTIVRRDRNLGYGGNQIACYTEAIADGIDVVAVVHGDGQYPPELLDELIEPIVVGRADAVFGSRMLIPHGARRGGMPMARRVGNRALSTLQNALTGAGLSEWHSGFRAYRCSTLAQVRLSSLTSGFDFDTAITLRLLDLSARIEEIPIATHYGDEVSYIDPYRTGVHILRQTVAHRLGLGSARWREASH